MQDSETYKTVFENENYIIQYDEANDFWRFGVITQANEAFPDGAIFFGNEMQDGEMTLVLNCILNMIPNYDN